jgi:hypothetical protein
MNNSEQHWLFDTNQYLIYESHLLYESDNGQDKPVIAILYQLIKQDSNADQRLSSNDSMTIGISKPNGTAYQTILENVDDIVGKQLVDNQTLLLLYHSQDKVFSAHVDLNHFTIRNQVALPKLAVQ